ncbi:MAG TPA: DUF3888 domain-containing protein [Pseudogracilibacillus sp.]|nr:DUF3888 domain-containing protein [Pseudogracilibacillus sp.]
MPQNEPPSIMEKALLRSLDDIILETMTNHGNQQLFEFGRIEKISGDNQYDITLRVIGFEGAHNPPYTLIRMTIRIPGDDSANYTVVDYSHRKISNEEFKKLVKFSTYN